MKKLLTVLCIAFATVIATGTAFATYPSRHQIFQVTEGDYSHWSVAVGGGLDYYRVAPFSYKKPRNFFAYYFDESGVDQMFNPQLSVEYTFNTLYGFGIHYGHFGFNRMWRNGETNYGATNDFSLYGSVDLSDLLSPCRTGIWQRISLYGDVGAGMAFYLGKMAQPSGKAGDSGAFPMDDYDPWDDPEAGAALDYANRRYNGLSPFFTTFLNAEFSLSRRFALGLGFGYRWYLRHSMGGWWSNSYSKDDFDGRWQTNTDENGDYQKLIAFEPMNNDGWNLTLSLRFKMGNGKKKHIRDVRMCGANAIVGCDPTINERIIALEQKLAASGGGSNCCETVAQKLDDINNNLKNLVPSNNYTYNNTEFIYPDTTKRRYPLGIPANPDNPEAVEGTYIPAIEVQPGPGQNFVPRYDRQGPATGILAGIPGVTGAGTKESPWRIHNVNFVFDKTVLIERSNPIISEVLHTLIAHYDEWHVLKIDGHTDWFGTEKYNEGLANRRAAAIKKYFIDHGLGEKVFITEGFGETRPIAPNETPDHKDDPVGRQENRRVELYIIR